MVEQPNETLRRCLDVMCFMLLGFVHLQAQVLQQGKIELKHCLAVFGPLLLLLVFACFVTEPYMQVFFIADILGYLYMLGFIFHAMYVLKRWDKRMLELYSDVVNKQTAWFRQLTWTIAAIPLLWIPMAIWPELKCIMVVYYVVELVVMVRFTAFALTQEVFEIDEEEIAESTLEEANASTVEAAAESQSNPLWTEKLDSLMNEEHVYRDENLTSAQLATMLNTNRTYLSQYLNDVCHTTFCDYINQLRLKECETLLDEGKLDLQDIALQCGFKDRRSLYRIFTKYHGVSPSDWKNRETTKFGEP